MPRDYPSDTPLLSGTKNEPKPKLLSPDIFRWGRDLPREGVGAKKFGMSLETQGIKLFWRDIPGFCRDIPKLPEKFEKKKFGFNFRSLYCALWGFWCLNMANWVRYPLPLFCAFPRWRACEVEVTPHKRGTSAILARYHMKKRQIGCDTAMLSPQGIARYEGVSRPGPLSSKPHCKMPCKLRLPSKSKSL